MTTYYDVLINSEHDKSFKNSEEDKALEYFIDKGNNPTLDVKLVLHKRRVLKHSKVRVI